jgi:peptidoglycan/xylan/chitin deacetylase (PgdA/CDA1 family)
MSRFRTSLTSGIFNALYYSGAYRLVPDRFRGIGAVLMFHRVLPAIQARAFSPSRHLAIEAAYLEAVIGLLRDLEYDIVDLTEAHRRLLGGGGPRRFACLTFDDGYADTYQYAFPICRRLEAPMVVYLCTGLVNRDTVMWEPGLEAGLAGTDDFRFAFAGRDHAFACRDAAGKQRAFDAIRTLFRSTPLAQRRALADALSAALGVDIAAIGEASTLTWDSIGEMHASGLAEFGAHTVSHAKLNALEEAAAREEIQKSRCEVSDRLGATADHFAYPYGGPAAAGPREFALCEQLGFKTAVTTRHGLVQPQHRGHLHSLPRIPIDGHRQTLAPLRVMLSGASTALLNGFNPVVTD